MKLAVVAESSRQARRRDILQTAVTALALLVVINVLAAWTPGAALKPDSKCTISRRVPPENTIADVAVGTGRQLVAVGWVTGGEGKDGAVWRSQPDAPSPRPVDITEKVFGGGGDQYVNAVIPYGSGFLAVGSDNDRATVWTSINGRAWERQDLGRVVGERSSMRSVIKTTDKLVVGGWVCLGDAGGRKPAVWTAEHGLAWARTELPTDEAFKLDPAFPEAQVNDLIEFGSQLIAVGTVRTEPIPGRKVNWDAAIWSFSARPDGWKVVDSVDHDDGFGDQYISSVTAWRDGMVAVGGEGFLRGTNTAMWFYSNGKVWQRKPQVFDQAYEVLSEAQSINSVTAIGDTLIAVGYTQLLTEKSPRSKIWSSTDGRQWAPVQINDLPSEARSVQPLAHNSGESGIVVGWRQGPRDNGRQSPWIMRPLAVTAALTDRRPPPL